MRSGKTEYAMGAAVMTGVAGRQVRRALGVVETKLESRSALTGTGRERKAAKRNQQALRGNGIGDDDADNRSPQTPGPHRASEHAAAHREAHLITKPAVPKASVRRFTSAA
jgi:hypothetical protein